MHAVGGLLADEGESDTGGATVELMRSEVGVAGALGTVAKASSLGSETAGSLQRLLVPFSGVINSFLPNFSDEEFIPHINTLEGSRGIRQEPLRLARWPSKGNAPYLGVCPHHSQPPPPSSTDTVFRTACEVLSGAVKESPGSSRCVNTGRPTRARVPRGRVLRASGVTVRTPLDLHGMTVALLNGQTWLVRQEVGCRNPRALPNPWLQGSSFCHRLYCLPVTSAGFLVPFREGPSLVKPAGMLSVAGPTPLTSPRRRGAPVGLSGWAALGAPAGSSLTAWGPCEETRPRPGGPACPPPAPLHVLDAGHPRALGLWNGPRVEPPAHVVRSPFPVCLRRASGSL